MAEYQTPKTGVENIDKIHERTQCPIVTGQLSGHPDSLINHAATLAATPGPLAQNYEAVRSALKTTYLARQDIETVLHTHTQTRAVPRRRDGSIIESFIPAEKVEIIRQQMTTAANKAGVVLDQAVARTTESIGKLQSAIDDSLKLTTDTPRSASMSGEIRSHVKGLGAQGVLFVQTAIKAGDSETVKSVLSAPAYLSGPSESQIKILKQEAIEKFCADDYSRLQASNAMLLHLSNAASELGQKFKKLLPASVTSPNQVVRQVGRVA
jgi:hypothetical protein